MRIGMMGDYLGMTTSYGVITYNMLMELKKRGHEVYNLALQYPGSPTRLEDGIRVFPAGSTEELRRSLLHAKLDVVIHLRDNWIYTPYAREQYTAVEAAHEAGTAFVNYTPIQAYPLPQEYEDSVWREADLTLFTTKWATDYFRKLGNDNVEYLYHGIQEGIKPTGSRKRPAPMPKDATMIMNVGYALDMRKMTPLVLLLTKRYREYDPAAFAYLHTQVRSHFFNDIIARHIGLPRDAWFVSTHADPGNAVHSVSPMELNQIYNGASVYVNFSTSEGFDLTSLEAASLGLPVLCTDFPVHREVLAKYPSVHYVKSRQEIPSQPWGFEWFADMDDALNIMLDLKAKGFRRTKAHVEKEHTYPYVVERLEKILSKIL